jgi:hypothetical protein
LGGARSCGNEIADCFRLKEVEFAVENRATREFARGCCASAGADEGGDDRCRYSGASVRAQLDRVLAGE